MKRQMIQTTSLLLHLLLQVILLASGPVFLIPLRESPAAQRSGNKTTASPSVKLHLSSLVRAETFREFHFRIHLLLLLVANVPVDIL